jgi:hypothetical protein
VVSRRPTEKPPRALAAQPLGDLRDVLGVGAGSVERRGGGEVRHLAALGRPVWRDPGSNRGHHDFQWRAPCSPLFLVVQNFLQISYLLK